MKTIGLVVLLIMVLSTIGCIAVADVNHSSSFVYFQDSETKICFSMKAGGGTIQPNTMTSVPCTPEVLKAIERDKLR